MVIGSWRPFALALVSAPVNRKTKETKEESPVVMKQQMNGTMSNGKKRKASVDEIDNSNTQTALRVHRCRFVEWMPEAIHAMDFNANGDLLAVARSNGDLQIWTVGKKWHLNYVISGSENCKISALKWSASGRLFVASFDGTLWEIDFHLLRRKHVTDSNGGPIWCLEINDESESLAIGCEDGRIRLFSFENEDLYFRKGFITTGTRIVSLAWHKTSDKMFSGSEDGIIHCWNAASGRNESRITLETLGKQKCVVWSLLVLGDMTVVSGDSHGNLNFWSGTTGTLMQKFSQLTADILTLCTDKNNSVLFASGVDNQVVQFRRVTDHETSWAYSYSHRAHSHDVRALALSNAVRPVLVSGGIDTQLVWYQAQSFNVHRPIKIPSMPYPKTVSLSSEQRVLLVQKSKSLDLWRLASSKKTDVAVQPEPKLLVELHINDSFNVSCSALSSDGRFVSCSTPTEVKLFALDASAGFRPHKLQLPPNAREAARTLAFSPDSTRLVIGTESGKIKLLDLKKMEVLKTFSHDMAGTKSAVPVVSLSVSNDGQWLGVGNVANDISVYNLDSMQFYCSLPRPSVVHTSLGFNPSGSTLIVTLASNSFVSYDVEKKALTSWYREHHERFPAVLRDGKNIKGMAFDPAHPDVLYLYSQADLYQINMASDSSCTKKEKKKAKKDGEVETEAEPDSNDFCRVINRYRPLSFVDFVGENEMIVVETPWLKVLSRLPGALQRHKYGR